MSMLAERRQKTKYVIHPNKKPLWKIDEEGTKFGKQLMEKMGWSAGKGLGAKEQGISEPIRIGYKNDTRGMGFKDNDDNWFQNQQEFDSLLNELKSVAANGIVMNKTGSEIESLEEKSKKSKARVHYQKFMRSKDLARYSKDDLACILGNKKRKKDSKGKPERDDKEEESKVEKENSFGVTTVNGGSLADYFKRKWKNLEKTTEEMPPPELRAESKKMRKGDFEESKEAEPSDRGAETVSAVATATETDRTEENLFGSSGKTKKRKTREGDPEHEANETEHKKKKKKSKDEEKTMDVETERKCFRTRIKRKTEKNENVLSETHSEEREECEEKKNESPEDCGAPFSENSNKIKGKKKKKKAPESGNPEKSEVAEDRPNEEKRKEICSKDKIKSAKKFNRLKILNLVCDVRLDKFKGSNLEKVSGYGAPKPKR